MPVFFNRYHWRLGEEHINNDRDNGAIANKGLGYRCRGGEVARVELVVDDKPYNPR